jgi:hypothetical protein
MLPSGMSPTELILSKLNKVSSTGQGKWKACCPAHEDKNPSMTIRSVYRDNLELALVHCFCGCTPNEILGALGLELSDLYETPPIDIAAESSKRKSVNVRRPFVSSDAFEQIEDATSMIYMLACDMQSGRTLDMTALKNSIAKLNNVAETCFDKRKFINKNVSDGKRAPIDASVNPRQIDAPAPVPTTSKSRFNTRRPQAYEQEAPSQPKN